MQTRQFHDPGRVKKYRTSSFLLSNSSCWTLVICIMCIDLSKLGVFSTRFRFKYRRLVSLVLKRTPKGVHRFGSMSLIHLGYSSPRFDKRKRPSLGLKIVSFSKSPWSPKSQESPPQPKCPCCIDQLKPIIPHKACVV